MFKSNSFKYFVFAIAFTCMLQSVKLQGVDFLLENIKAAINRAQEKKKASQKLLNQLVNNMIAVLGTTTNLFCGLKPKDTEQEELKKEYRQLLKRELALEPTTLQYIKGFFIQDTKWENDVAQYRKDLLLFFHKLFRHVVKHDIKNKAAYTISLGLKIANDGTLTMERSPLDPCDACYQHELLSDLSMNPNDESAIERLKKIYGASKNPSKSAGAIFPGIFIIKNDDTTTHSGLIPAWYAGGWENKIYVREQCLSIRHCRIFLHEFTHALQRLQGKEIGGYKPGSIASPQNMHAGKIMTKIMSEIEAEARSIQFHPDPEDLLLTLENQWWNWAESMESRFPYFTIPEEYALALEYFKLQGNPKYAQSAKIALDRRKGESLRIIETYVRILHKEAPISEIQAYPACLELLVKELRNTDPEGCKKFFDIKCKVLGIGQEEKKLENKIENSKNNILEK